MSTEGRNPRSFGLDKMSPREIVRLMNEEEHQVLRAVQECEEEIAVAAQKVAESYERGGRIIYVGSGTSGRIAMMDAAEMPPTFGVEPGRFIALQSGGTGASFAAMEDAEDDPHAAIHDLNELGANRNDIVIGIAASGRTPYVLGAIKHANAKGIWTCAITNNDVSPIAQEADHHIELDTGPEILTGSTRLKAGTAQKLVLNRISTIAMVLNGKVIENLMVDVKPKNQKLKERCVRIVRDLSTLSEDEAWAALESHDWSVRKVLEEANVRA